jgi:hypothetical protein
MALQGMGTVAGDITEINLNDPKRTVVMEVRCCLVSFMLLS